MAVMAILSRVLKGSSCGGEGDDGGEEDEKIGYDFDE